MKGYFIRLLPSTNLRAHQSFGPEVHLLFPRGYCAFLDEANHCAKHVRRTMATRLKAINATST